MIKLRVTWDEGRNAYDTIESFPADACMKGVITDLKIRGAQDIVVVNRIL